MTSEEMDAGGITTDIVALHLEPLTHVAVFAVDHTPGPLLPPMPLGACSLHAAFNANRASGKAIGVERNPDSFAFLAAIVAAQPYARELHVVADNLLAVESAQIRHLHSSHHNVFTHFSPSYSSWLGQVESWLSKIERATLGAGTAVTIPQLKEDLLKYIDVRQKEQARLHWLSGPMH